jgi:hypothetical protein
MRRTIIFGVLLTGLVVGAGATWLERARLRTWYYLRGLRQASDEGRQAWIERLAQLDARALPGLLDYLRRDDLKSCANSAQAMIGIAKDWPEGDARLFELADKLAAAFGTRSPAGQLAVLEVQAFLLRTREHDTGFARLVSSAGRVVAEAARQPNANVRRCALAQARSLLESGNEPSLLECCGKIVSACLHDDASATRIDAIRLAMRPDLGLLDQVVPLLNDADAEVRRGAILAVGTVPAAISTDELLCWLHDPDQEVRLLCEEALRSRGLQEQHLKLGRFMTDGRPEARLQVLDLLRRSNDLDPGTWLRRMSHDSSPAVRAAVVRAATDQSTGSLRDRLEEMAQNDPSQTVRQIAQYYLSAPPTR